MRILIGSKIYALRKQINFTQEQLAVELGVSAAAVSKWETQNVVPDIETLCVLADFFHITVDELLGRRGDGYLPISEDRDIMETAVLLIKLSELARNRGLLALPEYLETETEGNAFFRFSVSYAIDMMCKKEVSPQLLSEWLNNYANSLPDGEQKKGKMIVTALMLIISGENTEILSETLASMFSFTLRESFYSYICGISMEQKEIKQKIEAWMRENRQKEFLSSSVMLEELLTADDLLIQLMLRYLDNRDVVLILKGSSYDICCRIMQNMSDRLLYFILEDMENCILKEEEVRKAQEKAAEIIHSIERRVNSHL